MALYVTYLGHVIHNKTLCAIKNGACRSQHVGHNTTLCNVPDHKASFCTRHQTTVTTQHCAMCQTTKLHFAPDTRPQSQHDTVRYARPQNFILHQTPDHSHNTTLCNVPDHPQYFILHQTSHYTTLLQLCTQTMIPVSLPRFALQNVPVVLPAATAWGGTVMRMRARSSTCVAKHARRVSRVWWRA
jgi:hypothetical protein